MNVQNLLPYTRTNSITEQEKKSPVEAKRYTILSNLSKLICFYGT